VNYYLIFLKLITLLDILIYNTIIYLFSYRYILKIFIISWLKVGAMKPVTFNIFLSGIRQTSKKALTSKLTIQMTSNTFTIATTR
jgi:hypothetical protein